MYIHVYHGTVHMYVYVVQVTLFYFKFCTSRLGPKQKLYYRPRKNNLIFLLLASVIYFSLKKA